MSDLETTRQQFRDAMSRLSAAVSVVTSDGEAGRCGLTATAVCSVTDSPPTLLLCINRNSALNSVFKDNRQVCINLLSAEQEAVARDFAGMTDVPMAQRFDQAGWQLGEGAPWLEGALANLQGRIDEVSEVGSHSLLLVRLEDIHLQQPADGLVYFSRRFHRLPQVA